MDIYCVMEAQFEDEPGALRGLFLSQGAAWEEAGRLQEQSAQDEETFDADHTEFFVEKWTVRDAKALDVYFTIQRKFDMDYLQNDLIDMYNDDGSYDEMQQALRQDPALCERVAKRYRKYLEDLYGTYDEFDCLRHAFAYCTENGR